MASVVAQPNADEQQRRVDAFRWYRGVGRVAIAASVLSASVLFVGNSFGDRTAKRSPLIRSERPAEVVGGHSVTLDTALPEQRGEMSSVGVSRRGPLMRREKPGTKAAAAAETNSKFRLAGFRSTRCGTVLAAVALIGFALQVKGAVVSLLNAGRTVNGVDEKQK
eukprot:TRINITY_DN55536_c0_g1_i1.p1 TRINITY_DN55536_c0_g1~~TRINITY_DN55536_c0_g1_i1.p1  ORF type:complete len:189 (-),score=27.66 TRINITY_DN55536_c0_g1_i1:96-590(-)